MSLDWMEAAACAGADPDMFFTEERRDEAKAVCGLCPVRLDCLDYALETGEYKHNRDGVWGGLTPSELRKERKERRNRAIRKKSR